MLMVHHDINFHMPISNDSLLIAIQRKLFMDLKQPPCAYVLAVGYKSNLAHRNKWE
jgi:hypothetical protein